MQRTRAKPEPFPRSAVQAFERHCDEATGLTRPQQSRVKQGCSRWGLWVQPRALLQLTLTSSGCFDLPLLLLSDQASAPPSSWASPHLNLSLSLTHTLIHHLRQALAKTLDDSQTSLHTSLAKQHGRDLAGNRFWHTHCSK